MADDRSEALAIWGQYDGKPEDLANHLTFICICQPGVVYQVFQILDDYSRYDVVCRFTTKINKSSLYKLASTKDGLILCKFSYIVLDSYRRAAQLASVLLPPSCKQTESTFRLFEHVIKNSATIANEYLEPRQLSSCEMDYYANYNDGKDASKSGPKKPFKPEICWQLPRRGTGYVVYSPDDLDNAGRKQQNKTLLNDAYGYDQIATKETIEAAMKIALDYANKPLQYGDFSRPGGINTPDHGTHNVGMAWDMRYLRNDNLLQGLTLNSNGNHPSYHRDDTKEFIRRTRRLYSEATFYANDPALAKEFPGIVSPSDGHWNHIHVMPFLKGRE